MDFTKEITAFPDWLETNPLDATAQSLWYHLMTIWQKCGSPEWFTVANPTLKAKLGGVSEPTLIKHRNTLMQKGRLNYKSQGKQQAGKYQMISLLTEHFTKNILANSLVNDLVNPLPNHSAKGSALFDTQTDTSTDSQSAGARVEDPWQTMQREFAELFGYRMIKPHYDIVNEYLNDGMELEVVVLALYACKPHKPDYDEYLWRVIGSWFTKGVLTVTDYRRRQEELAAEIANQPRQKRGPKVVSITAAETDHAKAGQAKFAKVFGNR